MPVFASSGLLVCFLWLAGTTGNSMYGARVLTALMQLWPERLARSRWPIDTILTFLQSLTRDYAGDNENGWGDVYGGGW
jgi:hypothetical protein